MWCPRGYTCMSAAFLDLRAVFKNCPAQFNQITQLIRNIRCIIGIKYVVIVLSTNALKLITAAQRIIRNIVLFI